jgi:hypothetical protein
MGNEFSTLVPKEIMQELGRLEVPYSIEHGGRHIKIKVNGVLAGILPQNGRFNGDMRATLNVRAQIRRAAKRAEKG